MNRNIKRRIGRRLSTIQDGGDGRLLDHPTAAVRHKRLSAVLSLALNLVLTGVLIAVVERLLARVNEPGFKETIA